MSSEPPRGPFQIVEFRRLWIGQTVSQLGDALYGLTFVFMAGRLSGSAVAVGLVAAAAALPFLIFGPFAGVAADRRDRRVIMLACDLASAAILMGLACHVALAPKPDVVVIGVTGFLLSSVNAYFLPARGAAIPRLVPPELLQSATAISTATMSTMHMAGVGLAAILLGPIETLRPQEFFLWAIVLNAATFVVSAYFISRLPPIAPDPTTKRHDRLGQDIRDGVNVVRNEPLLRVMFPISFLVNLAISGFYVVYIVTNTAWFDGRFLTISTIEFSFFASMLVGSVLMTKIQIRRPGLAFALGCTFLGLTVAGMAWGRQLWVYIALNVLAGLVLPAATIPPATYANLAVPDEFRGRVNAVSTIIGAGVQPLGTLVTGYAISRIPLMVIYLAMGLSMSVAATAGLCFRAIRRIETPS